MPGQELGDRHRKPALPLQPNIGIKVKLLFVLFFFVSTAFAGAVTQDPKPKISLPNNPPCFVEVGEGSHTELLNPALVTRIKVDKDAVLFYYMDRGMELPAKDPRALVAKFLSDVKENCK